MEQKLWRRVMRKLYRIWVDEESYIFDGGLDILGGVLVLVVWPGVSVYSTLKGGTIGFSEYIYPIITVAFADIYDTINRCTGASYSKRFKLVFRGVLDVVAIGCAMITPTFPTYGFVRFLPAVVLLINGVLLSVEVYRRSRMKLFLWTGK